MQHPITIRNTGVRITEVLDLLAKAYSYEQIVKHLPALTLSDVMVAAGTASRLINEMIESDDQITVEGELKIIARNNQIVNLTGLHKEHPRAYEPWSREEQEQMIALYQEGKTIKEICETLERQPSAIRTRLGKAGLLGRSRRSENNPEAARSTTSG
jgi:uncharacterized protein (DUF433 family)